MDDDAAFFAFMQAIARGDRPGISRLLRDRPLLASAPLRNGATRQAATEFFLEEIRHHVYRGDTAVHIAAAAYDVAVVRELVAAGAAVDVTNRRGAQPLHYAVDGGPGSPTWDPHAQHDTVSCLVELGADPNATDKNGTTPLLRAVRNRCASAVRAVLANGADPAVTNANGSSALQLATWTTGRGGSGSPAAKAQRARDRGAAAGRDLSAHGQDLSGFRRYLRER